MLDAPFTEADVKLTKPQTKVYATKTTYLVA